MTEKAQIELAQLNCKILSTFVNFDWGWITFDCLTIDHVIYKNTVLEEKQSRVKLTLKYKNLESLQSEVFDKLVLLSSHATFEIDPDSKRAQRREDGLSFTKYKTTDYPSTSKCLAQ